MIVVSFDKELREAFEAGKSAALSALYPQWKAPQTYEEWIESRSNEPQIVRGNHDHR